MRRLFAVTLLVLAACSSSSSQSGPKANVPQPDVAIEQISGPAESGYVPGPFEVKYRLEIQNKADVPLTLKRITITTLNPEGGAYTLSAPHDYYFNQSIPAGTTGAVEFWARALGYGRSLRETEPVTVRGIVYFSTPQGFVNQVFMRELGQL